MNYLVGQSAITTITLTLSVNSSTAIQPIHHSINHHHLHSLTLTIIQSNHHSINHHRLHSLTWTIIQSNHHSINRHHLHSLTRTIIQSNHHAIKHHHLHSLTLTASSFSHSDNHLIISTVIINPPPHSTTIPGHILTLLL